MRRLIAAALLCCSLIATATAEILPDSTRAARMDWFSKAKLGIFIHWGIYSKGETSESWAFHNGRISLPDYMAQSDYFTASAYDPEAWADLIAESGARYTVITTKHHDGFALWDTNAGQVSAVKSSPAGRDVIAPFAKAIKDRGIHLGLYYSLIDWPHPDYTDIYRAGPPRYKASEDTARWQRFLDFNTAQLDELSTRFNPDLYWFDGDWEHSAEEWKAPQIVARLREHNPNVIVNSRIAGYGDYDTPELGVPVGKPESQWWETCMTINDSWGYRTEDTDYKPVHTILCMLADCIGMGGNLLLDIGPRADGSIPDEEVNTLKQIGRWVNKHAEAVYETRAGLPSGHVHGYTSLSPDAQTLYVYLPYRPTETIELKGLKTPVKRMRVVGTDHELTWTRYNDIPWSQVPGVYYINVPDEVLDPEITVLAIELDGPAAVYRGSGHTITFNDSDQAQ